MDKILLISHCLLNPKVRIDGKEYDFVNEFKGYNIIQMPCPEVGLYPVNRKPKTRDMYDNKEYRKICKMYSEYISKLLKKMINAGGKPIAVIGIKYSPSCGVNYTTVGSSWAMKRKRRGIGIFIQELKEKLKENDINIQYLEFDFDNPEESIKKIKERIENA